jgi:hypothetical protein
MLVFQHMWLHTLLGRILQNLYGLLCAQLPLVVIRFQAAATLTDNYHFLSQHSGRLSRSVYRQFR